MFKDDRDSIVHLNSTPFNCDCFSLNAKLDDLRNLRAAEFLDKWRKSFSKTIKWIETYEGMMQFDVDEQLALVDVRKRLNDLDVSRLWLLFTSCALHGVMASFKQV